MKVNESMIDAACEASPDLQREHVTKIVQAALDAHDANSSPKPVWRTIIVAMAFSLIATFLIVFASLGASGTWLDPRVWSDTYVPGDTMASSMNNGTWMMEAAASASPLIFIGVLVLTLGVLFATQKLKKR